MESFNHYSVVFYAGFCLCRVAESAIIQNCHFLLSERMLCKISVVIVKKFDFEILTYLYVLRPPEFIYAIFKVIYVYVCMYVSEHDSV